MSYRGENVHYNVAEKELCQNLHNIVSQQKVSNWIEKKAFPCRNQAIEGKFGVTFSKNFILTYTKMMFMLEDTIPI